MTIPSATTPRPPTALGGLPAHSLSVDAAQARLLRTTTPARETPVRQRPTMLPEDQGGPTGGHRDGAGRRDRRTDRMLSGQGSGVPRTVTTGDTITGSDAKGRRYRVRFVLKHADAPGHTGA